MPANPTRSTSPSLTAARPRARVVGLDGVRGLAALFVVLHHCYLSAFPGYPQNNGPFWAAWMFYGHFAVAIFIVLSGFSLSISPVQADWQLGGVRRFLKRRAFRILPPYWAAFVFSLLIAWFVVPQPGEGVPTLKTLAVEGLLIQDVTHAPSANGAFWSIAVEAQLYFVFPLMLLVVRRVNAPAMISAMTGVVVLVGLAAPHAVVAHKLLRFTPQFAALFAVGVVAAGVLRADRRWRDLPWHWFSLAAAAPVVAVIAWRGSVWTADNFFWVDLGFGPAIGCLLAAISIGRPVPLARVLNTRPMRSLGSFSYSLYLVHAPIVVVVAEMIVAGRVAPGVPSLLVTIAIAVPATLVFARGFAAVFEIPFQRYRSWNALRAAVRTSRTPARHRAGPATGRLGPVRPTGDTQPTASIPAGPGKPIGEADPA